MEQLVQQYGNDPITILLSLKYCRPMFELKFVHSHKQDLVQQNTLCEACKKGCGKKTDPLTLMLQLTAQFTISSFFSPHLGSQKRRGLLERKNMPAGRGMWDVQNGKNEQWGGLKKEENCLFLKYIF